MTLHNRAFLRRNVILLNEMCYLCIMKKWTLIMALCLLSMPLRAVDKGEVGQWLAQMGEAQNSAQRDAAGKLMAAFHEEELTDELVQFAAGTPSTEVTRQVWYWAGEYYYAQADYKPAVKWATKALPLMRGKPEEADCLNLLALTCFRLSDYEQAVDYAKQCYALDEKTGDPDMMSSSLNTIAGIYIGANQPGEAEKYVLKGIELAQKAHNQSRLAVLHGMASEVYHAQANDKKALEHIETACKIEQLLGDEQRLLVRLTQKASVLNGLKRYDDTERLLGSVIPRLRKTPDRHSLGIACNKMGKALLEQHREREAIVFYHEAAAIFMTMGDGGNEMHARRGLYESFWSINPDSARLELNRFNFLKDSLYSHASAESLARYNAEFGNDWLHKENEAQRARNRYLLVGGVVLALVLALAVWLVMRRRMRRREASLQAIIKELRQKKPVASDVAQAADPDRRLLERLVEQVERAMDSQGDLSLETLASALCVTRGHLNRRVKAATGATAQQFVTRARMERAMQLLRDDPSLTVAQVADRCGFDDATSFSRAFRRTFGAPPSHFRQ